MQSNSSEYKVPSFAAQQMYNFDMTDDTLAVYRELSTIAEEIEKCRLRNV